MPKLKYAQCDSCGLKDYPLVHPSGDGRDYIAFVGEAPGEKEVERDAPFVGESGQLLRVSCSKVDLDIERIYFTNGCMCRPPKNRDPVMGEVNACNLRLAHELAAVRPKIVIPLGAWGQASIVGKKLAIRKNRGKPHWIKLPGGFRTLMMSSIHPAALLRSGDDYPDLLFDLTKAKDILDGGPITIKPPIEDYYLIHKNQPKRMAKLLKRLENVEEMALDLETEGLQFARHSIVTCALSFEREKAVAFDWEILEDYPDLKKEFGEALKRIRIVPHNGLFDIPWLRDAGFDPWYYNDTMLDNYALNERQGVHDLERLAVSYYLSPTYKFSDEKIKETRSIPIDDLLTYNATDADYTFRLSQDLPRKMDKMDRRMVKNVLMPAARHFSTFTMTGMKVDDDQLHSNIAKWESEIAEIEERLRSHPKVSKDMNFNSPKQVAKFIYDTLEMNQMGGGKIETIDQAILLDEIQDIEDPEAQEYWRTQSSRMTANMGPRSTNTYMLFWLAQQADGGDWCRDMVYHRLASKKLGTYGHGLDNARWADGRIRPSVRLHGTVTGRQSTSGPNIHGTPRNNDIKASYRADDGFVLLYGDYPQAEVRMVGHYAQDKALIKSLHENDIHYAIMKMLFRLTDEDVAKLSSDEKELMRRAAKTITFGIIYGRSARGLAPQIGISVDEAQDYIDGFFRAMPDVLYWKQEQGKRVVIDHYVTSLYGRKRRFPLIANKRMLKEIQRQAVNMPIQSSVSDMTLMAYLKTCRKFEEEGIIYLRWPQVHDCFMVQVEEAAMERGAQIMKDTMENDLDFETDVPFGPVEIKSGESWGRLHTVLS